MATAKDIRHFANAEDYTKHFIVQEEIDKYLPGGKHFIDEDLINRTLAAADAAPVDPVRIREILAKSEQTCETLTVEEVAALMRVEDPALFEEMRAAADRIKHKVYDNRIVMFAPLYVSNLCVNGCRYCGFRSGNELQKRRVLTMDEVKEEVDVLAGRIGHKRLIAVYGEHPTTSTEYIAETIETCYNRQVKAPKTGAPVGIRRVNVNAAPLPVADLRVLHEVGIGTFQVFQETYNRKLYESMHPAWSVKGNYDWRTTCFHRCMEAGVDDVGLGVLYGLCDWRFELLATVLHARDLERWFNIGPHTISFPRIKDASGLNIDKKYFVDDDTFEKIIAIFRLAVPYTGMILTAREDAAFRAKAIEYGISQIDGGTNLQIGDYKYHHEEEEKNSDKQEDQNLHREQFKIGDDRSLGDIIDKLLDHDFIPSFCTACYRLGRTGEHFMEFSVPGFIKRYCTPNAILTLSEYLVDYATPEVAAKGWKCIENNFKNVDPKFLDELKSRIERIKKGERDLYF